MITPQKYAEFSYPKSVFHYLQLYVHRVIVDHIRACEQATLLAEDHEPDDLAFSSERVDESGNHFPLSSHAGIMGPDYVKKGR